MPEIVVIFIVILLIFGPAKLPDLGKSLGAAIRGLRKAMNQPGKSDRGGSDRSEPPRESSKSNLG
jgi:sec-independent protein translocase protein TatA